MRLIYTLSVLLTVTTNIILSAPTDEPLTLLTPELDIKMDNYAWMYAQFSLTFDGSELPLEQNYLNNREEYEKFEDVQNFYSDAQMMELFSNVDIVKLRTLFEKRMTYFQSRIVDLDYPPMKFNKFYIIYQKIVHDNLLGKYLTRMEVAQCNSWFKDDGINEALHNFKIVNPFEKFTNKNEKKAYQLSDQYFKGELRKHTKELGLKDNEWTSHHIIPQTILVQFYNNYFKLLETESEEVRVTHKYNWVKIKEFNVQKSFLIQSVRLWSFSTRKAELPYLTGDQQAFIRAQYRWPKGLIMMGPSSQLRYDDPGNTYGYYESNNDGFEERAKHIISTRYFKIVKQLYTDLVAFNNECDVSNDFTYLSQKSKILRARLERVHEEYNNGKPIWIFPCNSKQWIKPSTVPKPEHLGPGNKNKPNKNQVWGINTDFNADAFIYYPDRGEWIDMNDNSDDGPSIEMWQLKMEWREKALAQEEYTRRQLFEQLPLELPVPNFDIPVHAGLGFVDIIGAEGSRGPVFTHFKDETRRRKRQHTSNSDPMTYISELRDKCKTLDTTTTTTESVIKVIDFNQPRTDSCGYYLYTGTPSILAVPYWGLCKLFG